MTEDSKLFYEHLATDDADCQFYVDLCRECHEEVMNGVVVDATDIPHAHTVTEEWSRAYGEECHVCGNWEVE